MGADAFSTLDTRLPLALLPIRLEARYLPRVKPTHLLVRIFPDVIHADAHRPGLSAREADAGRHFWTSIWGQADTVVISEARRWLASQTTPYRALWVAEATTPTNVDGIGDPAQKEPMFPALPLDERVEPVRAALLPDQWTVRLYDSDLLLVHTVVSEPVLSGLAMAPTLSSAGIDAVHPKTGAPLSAPLAFLAGQDLLWTVDFEQAEAVGMGVRIPITDVPNPVGAALAMGVRAGRTAIDEGDLLDSLLASHWYTRGLDLVPQGTPTNSTDAGRSGVSLSAPDIDELFERQASTRPVAPAGRALLIAADPALLYRIPAADSTSLAFGRIRTNTLDRVANADWAEGAAAWAMNLAIGYTTLAGYLNGPLAKADGAVATGDHTPTLRDWYVDWVRGGATLPTLRCGEQPYGLLPITHRPVEHVGAIDFESAYEHHLTQFLRIWTDTLPVAALDPNATDSRPDGTEIGDASIIAEVLGAVPHPTTLQLRRATDHLPDDAIRLFELMDDLQTQVDGDVHLARGEHTPIYLAWQARKRWIFGIPDSDPPVPPPGVGAQVANLDLFRSEVAAAVAQAIEDHTEHVPGDSIIAIIDGELRPLLDFYRDAALAVPFVLGDWSEGAGLGSGDVVRLEGTTFKDESAAVHDLVTTNGDVAEIRDVIARAIELLDGAAVANKPPAQRERLVERGSPAPLLAHLIDINCRTVPTPEIGAVRVALLVLLAMIDSPRVHAPEAELERLLRETLGLSMYRIDAWVTAIAAHRLAEKRRSRPSGVQLGGYGWLLDLAKSDDPTSQGFIHAPSLQHAASAAVLRSGWSAYSTDSGETPLSVDLSSVSVRGAQWVLDGVRNGQDLAELLGARLERYLHDAHLDDWIETIRIAALKARGVTRTPTAIVDGVLAARSFSRVTPTDQEGAFRLAVNSATSPTSDPAETARRAGVRRALRRVAADLDAVADLTMAQSVHSLLQDNPEAASAALAVTGGGDGAVPRMDVTATQRDAQLISHRVVAIWAGSAPSAATPSPLEAAEPRLLRWLEQLLPTPDRVMADVKVTDPVTGAIVADTVALSDVGVTSVEAALLAGAAPSQARSRLGRAVAAAAATITGAELVVEVDLAAPNSRSESAVSVDELGLIGAAMLDVLGRARPLTAADLVLPAADVSGTGFDAVELERRAADVEDSLVGLLADLSAGTTDRVSALVRCASIGVRSAIGAIEAGAGDDAVVPIRAELKQRLESVAEPLPDRVETALSRLRVLCGETFPILPMFTPIPDPDRVAAAASKPRRQQVDDDGQAWLRQYARVRPDLGATVELLLLAGSAANASVNPLGLAQLPHTPGAWAAVDRPPDDVDRTTIVSLTGPGALGVDAGPLAGVVFDSWTEGIPRRLQQTGVAVHFDAPTARPPQAVLLSVVDDERGFSANEVADQLLHTVEMAKLRAVDPGALGLIGHYLPAVFVPDDVLVSGDAT